MIPLIALSFALAYLVVERVLFFAQLRSDDISTDDVIGVLSGKGCQECEKKQGVHSIMLSNLLQAKDKYKRIDRSIVDEVIQNLQPEFSRHLKNIGALTSAAPLLGLLGTVSGMVTTFNVMNIFGTGNVKAMSGGISEALITTQYGLVVAIIGLYVSMILNRRAQKYETIVHDVGVHIIRKFDL